MVFEQCGSCIDYEIWSSERAVAEWGCRCGILPCSGNEPRKRFVRGFGKKWSALWILRRWGLSTRGVESLEKTSTRQKWIGGLKELAISLLVAAVVFGGIRAYRAQQLLDADGSVSAPELQLVSLSGEKHSLSELGSKPVLLHFWAPW